MTPHRPNGVFPAKLQDVQCDSYNEPAVCQKRKYF